ncbi:bifunctional methylenetetrahydrofolate dehydrogenase/methenyltetrahydrofolate cyclohydrolase FolD [Legionella sp. km772]|uniref:bifunctional methylenetetrahydrofolate dehydrogenase/methenyltetrahydrofolate cyclohydrolase FolD n=1 Tax=Legionella sp. km772 TaxID=2498111 RepID=UPI000F8E44A4|nr:bifunctional methylenetetrahydrofolate dehydrogenase/methenyltetrahydrofolate cyclohydrolase FolD [Legionella sp. km772]RUR09332.1 bifunctional methylenetetrahydrofolate dehydrogenase/methenyltetrahydrofolate cyclohydrolase FolD [Legionella sp. km772]
MPASLIRGNEVATLKKEELKQRVQRHTKQGHRAPGLAVVLVGKDPASSIYVNNKRKSCEEVGIKSFSYDLPESSSQEELLNLITSLNHANDVDGILIQLPLPSHITTSDIIEHLNPQKDVDGFHPYNLGRLAQRNPLLRPCTPLGIMNLLIHYQLDVRGKHAVVVGASNIVGRPLSLELLLAGATVTICHRFTKNLQQFVESADIVIVATGIIDVVSADWLQPHQILIDVGIHRLANGSIRGDVDFNKAKDKVSWISPVPGGVGPMTIVSLLENTLRAAGVAEMTY